jgi:hypothetical protein
MHLGDLCTGEFVRGLGLYLFYEAQNRQRIPGETISSASINRGSDVCYEEPRLTAAELVSG